MTDGHVQFRYGKSAITDEQRRAFPGAVGLCTTDGTEGGREWTVQGSHAAAGRLDGYGLCVSTFVVDGYDG
jgi:hypothetical protein